VRRTKVIGDIRVYDRRWSFDSLVWEFRAQIGPDRWYGRVESLTGHLGPTELGVFVAPITKANVSMQVAVDWDAGSWFDVYGHDLRPNQSFKPSIAEFLRAQEFWGVIEKSFRSELKRGVPKTKRGTR